VRELRQSVEVEGRGQQSRGHMRGRLHRRGGVNATGAVARIGQARAGVPGRTEAVTAPGGGKRVVHAF